MDTEAENNRALPEAMDASRLHALHLTSRILLVAPIFYLIVLFSLFPEHASRGLGPAILFCLAIATLLILRTGRPRLAAGLLVYGGAIGLAIAIGLGGGVYAPQVFAAPLAIVLAGWLFGPHHAVAITAISVLFGLAMAVATQLGLLPMPPPVPPLLFWISLTLSISLLCILTWYIVRSYERKLGQVQRLGNELSQRIEALALERNQFRLISENVPAMIAYNDREMVLRYANRRYLDFYGLETNAAIGRHIRDIIGAEQYARIANLLEQTLAGKTVSYRTTRQNAAGQPRLIEVDAVPELGPDGTMRGTFALLRDVTDQQRAQEALIHSEHKFSRIFQASPIATSLARFADGVFLDVNPAFTRVFGWTREELIGHASTEIGIWLSVAERQRWVAELSASGKTREFVVSWHNKFGETRTCQISADVLQIDGDTCILGMIQDITERKMAEEALRESVARLREAQRIGQVGSWSLDIASKRMTWSDELHRIFERSPENHDVTWQDLLNMTHSDDLPVVQKAWRESASAKGSYEIRHRIVTRDGRIKHLHVHWEVFHDADGNPVRALGTAQDITEQVLARAEIERLYAELEERVQERTAELTAANRELESFAYSISHDLRAPLRGIDGFSQLLTEEYRNRLDEKGIDYLDRVRRAAQRMGSLIDDILELSRVTRKEMRRSMVDLSLIAAEIVEERKRAEPERRVELVIGPGCKVFGDPQLLRVMMQNLLENAWKYSAKEATSKIEFGCTVVEGETVFFVRDNGVGFDIAYASRLFTPFQRLHKPEEFEGTGIGLASAARIVRRHSGRIWAEAAPGKGATFLFTLGESLIKPI